MKPFTLDLEQLEVESFFTAMSNDEGSIPVDGPEPATGESSFIRGCETVAFSCGGTCHYTCAGGFC